MLSKNTALLTFIALAFILATGCRKPDRPVATLRYPHYHLQELGSSAHDLLTAERFSALTVEVQYLPGQRPQERSLDSLKRFLQTYLHKPKGIHTVLREISPEQNDRRLTQKDVARLEDRYRTRFPVADTLTIHFLITDGAHTDPHMLGMAYRGTSAVLFGGTIARHSGPGKALSRAELETNVLLHEVGHLLSLGNPHGTAFNKRAGKGKEGHCEHESCLMYWATETRSEKIIRRRGRVARLDGDCLEALLANGGKRPQDGGPASWLVLMRF